MQRRMTNTKTHIASRAESMDSRTRLYSASAIVRRLSSRGRGFTLIELAVVMAIIAILVGLVLPGASAMWSQRNEAGTINLIRGLLESARSHAKRNGEGGIFVYVDPKDGVQRIAFIKSEPPNNPDAADRSLDRIDCSEKYSNPDSWNCVSQPMAVNRFVVTADKVYTVPSPYRVAPKIALEWSGTIRNQSGNPGFQQRLGNDLFYETDGNMRTPRQRNHFSVIFNRAGELVVGRDVLIHDPDNLQPRDQRGDKTQLNVTGKNQATQYYNYVNDGTGNFTIDDIDPNGIEALSDMVCHENLIVANFPSVDGLVVYDNSASEGLDGASGGEVAGRILSDVLLDNGRPIYITRQTGDIIMGEKGQ